MFSQISTWTTAPEAEATISPLLHFAGQAGRAKMVDLARGFWINAPRILPLKDSNTLGLSNVLASTQYESYRRELWSLAAEDRFWFDYAGSRANGPTSLLDRNHQGVSGDRGRGPSERPRHDPSARRRPRGSTPASCPCRT